jgi:rod shape determining protein RodA
MRIWVLPSLLFLFALLSIITLSSVAPVSASRQLLFYIVSGLLFYVVSQVPFSKFMHLRVPSYIFACLFLLIPFVFSLTTRNTARWIPVGDWFAIQPSQFTLPLVSFLLLWLVTTTKNYSWQFFLKFFGLLVVPAVIILMGPDLDTTIVVGTSLASLLFFLPISNKFFAGLAGGAAVLILFAWLVLLQPYQKSRITAFISPSQDMLGTNYNAQQALIAVGSGKFIGRGLGQGIQSHLKFLPEKNTDFIFASLAEEYGFIGTSTVVVLYILLISFLIWASQHISNQAGQLFLLIVAILFFLQASININMNIGLLPITGITLPLLSYGGSSLLGLCFTLGIAQSLIRETQKKTLLHIG